MNKLLLPQDVVGGSFWLISVAMIGAAIFFFLERGRLSNKWGTVMNLVGVIALMSAIHYFYAKNLWVLNGQAPTALRYIDWILTFPLTILTFYVMLKSVTDVKRGMFWRLLVGTLVWVSANLLGANAEVNEAGLAIGNYLPEISKQQHTELVVHFIKLVGNSSPWLVGFLAICAVASLQATATSFMSTTGNILSRDIYVHYFQKDSDDKKQVGVARLFTGLVFLSGMLLASFSMEATLLLGSLAIACSFQLWPSLLGATWLPWINRSGAIAGLSIGLLAVLLTEPIGQKLTGGAIPWGVWPWNVHSAVWGMFFNIVICMIISLMATNDPEKEHRQTFHNFFQKHSDIKSSDRWSKPVGALLLMIWMFFAIGPGSVFGNMAFGEPNIGYDQWLLGMPSIWAWQIIWWALGVGVVWFLANKLRMSTEPETEIKASSSD